MARGRSFLAVAVLAALAATAAACDRKAPSDEDVPSRLFPKVARPVAPIVSSRFSNEEERDRVREASTVMALSGIRPGMTVADIGAGEGYYTVRLATRVGAKGRVLAQDIVPAVRDRLAERVNRERLDNVSVKLGGPADPKLPANSFDRIFLVHMYHEIGAPYEFLWRLRPALVPGGEVVVVDSNRPTAQHGTPPALLDCEMRAVGYTLVDRRSLRSAGGYIALYVAKGPRPAPEAIAPCVPAPGSD